MNPEPPPIADPPSTAPVKRAKSDFRPETIRFHIYFYGAMLLAGASLRLFNFGMNQFDLASRFWFVPLILAALCLLGAIILWVVLWRFIKRNPRILEPPS